MYWSTGQCHNTLKVTNLLVVKRNLHLNGGNLLIFKYLTDFKLVSCFSMTTPVHSIILDNGCWCVNSTANQSVPLPLLLKHSFPKKSQLENTIKLQIWLELLDGIGMRWNGVMVKWKMKFMSTNIQVENNRGSVMRRSDERSEEYYIIFYFSSLGSQ